MIDLPNPLSLLSLNQFRCGYVRRLGPSHGGEVTDRMTLTGHLPFPLRFLGEDIVEVQVAISVSKLMETEFVEFLKVRF